MFDIRSSSGRRLLQFTLIHVGTALTVVPVTSVLNRVMIAEMGLSSTLVAFLVTLPYLLSPLQIWFGALMDRQTAVGGRFVTWIRLGGLMAAVGASLMAFTVFLIPESLFTGFAVTVVVFLVWGVGINLSSVAYLALLSARADPQERSRTVGVMFTAMIAASIGTGIFLSSQMEPYSQERLGVLLLVVPAVALVLVLLGALHLEQPSGSPTADRQPPQAPPGLLLRSLKDNPVGLRYFAYLMLVLLCIHTQDVLLEPFGAEVLGMSVSDTSRLVSIWGAGFLITMLAGIPLVRRYGERAVSGAGSCLAAAAFLLISGSGLLGQTYLFMGSVLVLGLGGGLMTQSNLTFMLRMTVPRARALYIGTWSVATFLAQAMIFVPVGLGEFIELLSGSPWLGYAAVFLLEGAGIIGAIFMLRSIRIESFQRKANEQLPDLPAAEPVGVSLG
ncbi:MAG: BCD family MFS transporter [Caldilineaceae bacterium SB0662_bin_9]|uniref:BCD family MFS transporter n=1 Tax=Caldilineaceae bacterium SB0662_bin_9 TaxID=2605258 RepID=A0A6B1DRX2_9CHLR|nr:BCD family MFS transporter [Caldilineaceae bacterium]MXZ41756.1 BCD family MFS transporter [Caldilineaceae bacterium SB0666_bin_21]MYD89941.1 BCD family MFS transporter [Caldilineaceae bacterium SB0662_bin_9]